MSFTLSFIGIMTENLKLLVYHAVNLDAGIGADRCAGGATNAGVLVGGIGKMITSIVNLLGLQCKNLAGAGNHA
jgi:hypothetical protein